MGKSHNKSGRRSRGAPQNTNRRLQPDLLLGGRVTTSTGNVHVANPNSSAFRLDRDSLAAFRVTLHPPALSDERYIKYQDNIHASALLELLSARAASSIVENHGREEATRQISRAMLGLSKLEFYPASTRVFNNRNTGISEVQLRPAYSTKAAIISERERVAEILQVEPDLEWCNLTVATFQNPNNATNLADLMEDHLPPCIIFEATPRGEDAFTASSF